MSEQAASLRDADQVVLNAARTLFVNGDDTGGVIDAASRLDRAMNRDCRVVPQWGEIMLVERGRPILSDCAVPWAGNTRRVTATLTLIDRPPNDTASRQS